MEIYRKMDPKEIATRCYLKFDKEKSVFFFRLLGTEYLVTFPDFSVHDSGGKEANISGYEKILIIRYLCDGKHIPSGGKMLSYNEFPWGELYYRNFEGRCLKRFAYSFGKNIPSFNKMIGQNPQLGAIPLSNGDASYRFEFINNLFVSVILWQADEEFPPSAQILFSDNFVFAFTAEDLAVVGDILINRLKELVNK